MRMIEDLENQDPDEYPILHPVRGYDDEAGLPFVILIDDREKAPFGFSGLSEVMIETEKNLLHTEFMEYRDDLYRLMVTTRRERLITGDYGCEGEPGVVVERKSLADFWTTILTRRDAFEGELERMNTIAGSHALVVERTFGHPQGEFDGNKVENYQWVKGFSCVVVEATWKEIVASSGSYTRMPVAAMFNYVRRWHSTFPYVQWRFCSSRREAEIFTLSFLHSGYWKRVNLREGGIVLATKSL